MRGKGRGAGVSTRGRSIHQQILDDLDDVTARYLAAKRAGTDHMALRYEMRGIARTIGRFGWAGVSSYYHEEGTRLAEKQSMARVKERLRGTV